MPQTPLCQKHHSLRVRSRYEDSCHRCSCLARFFSMYWTRLPLIVFMSRAGNRPSGYKAALRAVDACERSCRMPAFAVLPDVQSRWLEGHQGGVAAPTTTAIPDDDAFLNAWGVSVRNRIASP